MPRTVLDPFPFSFRKGSEAALLRRVTEHREIPAEPGRASWEPQPSTGESARAPGEPQGALRQFGLRGFPLGPEHALSKYTWGLTLPLAIGYTCLSARHLFRTGALETWQIPCPYAAA
jgi:hypothetical protein